MYLSPGDKPQRYCVRGVCVLLMRAIFSYDEGEEGIPEKYRFSKIQSLGIKN